jgi:lysophospholipase L1-like esterase
VNVISERDIKGVFDIVFLLIGVNDQFQHIALDEYRQELDWLIEQSIEYAGNRTRPMFLLSIPDYSVTPFARNLNPEQISTEIGQFNVIVKQKALEKNVGYINITDISRLALNDSSLVANDGLHPSPKMYTMWIERMLPVIYRLLTA